MRLRELAEKVEQLLQGGSGGGGGVPDYTRRFDRTNGDTAVGTVNVQPDGTVFIPTHFPTENVLVELVTDMTLAGGYGVVTPIIRNPANPTHPVRLAQLQIQGQTGDFYIPTNFIVPAGWEWTMEVNGADGAMEAIQISTVHETPLS